MQSLVYSILPLLEGKNSDEYIIKSREFAEKAVNLDSENPNAYRALAKVNFNDWEWEKAIRNYERGIELNSNSGFVNLGLGQVYLGIGKYEEAKINYLMALKLEPLSEVTYIFLGRVSMNLGNPDQALIYYNNALEVSSSYNFVYPFIASIYSSKKEFKNASEASLKFIKKLGSTDAENLYNSYFENNGYSEENYYNFQIDLYDLANSTNNQFLNSLTYKGITYLNHGRENEGFDILTEAVEQRDEYLVFEMFGIEFQPYKDDPRYIELLRKMDLLQYLK